jgi:hypothetical protein
MSGWQRIGVVISVLWLVGLPVYTLMHHNLSVQERTVDCVARLGATAEWCWQTFYQVPMSPLDVQGMLVGREPLVGANHTIEHSYNMELAMVVWGPIILLWLVGWIVFGTVRWVRRGFTGPGR